jgi:PhnB protein
MTSKSSKSSEIELIPTLVIKGAPEAIEFYKRVFDATVVACFADKKLGGHIVHAHLQIGGASFYLSEEARDWHNHAPGSLGGSPVVLHLKVPDVDAVAARLEAAGATVVFPVRDQFYGERSGRLRDPYGHLWLLSQRIRDMSDAEIQAGIDAYEG